MKTKMLKRIFAVVLALVTVFVPLVTAYAQGESTRLYPTIYVHGFMAKDIYKNPEDSESGTAWPLVTDDILTAVKEALPVIAKFAALRDLTKHSRINLREVLNEEEQYIYRTDCTVPVRGFFRQCFCKG